MTRPKLNAVFRGKADPEPAAPAQKLTAPDGPDKVQLNVMVSAELRRAARMKALEQGRDLAAVVRDLLTEWVKK